MRSDAYDEGGQSNGDVAVERSEPAWWVATLRMAAERRVHVRPSLEWVNEEGWMKLSRDQRSKVKWRRHRALRQVLNRRKSFFEMERLRRRRTKRKRKKLRKKMAKANTEKRARGGIDS